MELITHSVEETMALGQALAPHLKKGDVLLLNGDLGAGKTHFVKGLAKGLGFQGQVVSPTFNLWNNYDLPEGAAIPRINHFDVYRVPDEEEVLALGFEEAIYGEALSIIEWSDLVPGILPEDYLSIRIQRQGEDQRLITLTFSPGQTERSLPSC